MSDPANPSEGGPANSDGAVSIVDAEGNFSENYLEHFDEGDRPTLERFTKTGLKSLGKSYADLQRQFRSPDDYVKVPGDDSSDEDKAEFHRRRGVPDDVKDYKYEQPETLPENLRSSDEEMAHYYEMAKSANLTPKQFKAMADGHFAQLEKVYAAQDVAAEEANVEANGKADAELTRKFGNAKKERVDRANAIMNHYGGVEAVKALKLENNPQMVEFIDNIAEDMSEDRIKGITGASVPTNASIDAKMNVLRNTDGYFDKSHKDYKGLMEQRRQLQLQRTA